MNESHLGMFPAPKAATWLLCMHTARTKNSMRNILKFRLTFDMVSVVARARPGSTTRNFQRWNSENIAKNTNIPARVRGLRKQFFCNSTSYSTPQGRTGRPLPFQSPRKPIHRLVCRSRHFHLIFFRLIFCDFWTPQSSS